MSNENKKQKQQPNYSTWFRVFVPGKGVKTIVPRIEQQQSPETPKGPLTQSTLLWGAFSLFLTIVITVVATMMKDLRWLLIVAWPFAVIAIYEFLGYVTVKKSKRLMGTGLLGVVVAVGLLALHRALPVPKQDEQKSQQKETEERKLGCAVASIMLGPMFRFFQSPPVYFQKLDTAMRISLTNQSNRPLYLRDYSVMALKGTEWIQFKNADRADYEPYAFGVMQTGHNGYIIRADLTNNGFDYVMQQRPLAANESRELWMFFISGLKHEDLKAVSQVRSRPKTRPARNCNAHPHIQ